MYVRIHVCVRVCIYTPCSMDAILLVIHLWGMCIDRCIYVHMCVCIHTYVHTYVHAYIYIYIYIYPLFYGWCPVNNLHCVVCACTHACVCAEMMVMIFIYIYVYMHAYIHTYPFKVRVQSLDHLESMCTFVFICMCMYIHTYVHTHIRSCTYGVRLQLICTFWFCIWHLKYASCPANTCMYVYIYTYIL
jgi:hypothetical protein